MIVNIIILLVLTVVHVFTVVKAFYLITDQDEKKEREMRCKCDPYFLNKGIHSNNDCKCLNKK